LKRQSRALKRITHYEQAIKNDYPAVMRTRVSDAIRGRDYPGAIEQEQTAGERMMLDDGVEQQASFRISESR